MSAVTSFASLDRGMQVALDLAWASTRAGSLGIGAAALDRDGALLATGRNRIRESDPGDDVLAGSSLAHAEMNVLAKLPFRGHDAVELHTTLQPCLQCLGAIRLSSVTSVSVLAPDPLFRGVERIRDVNRFVARNWPAIVERPIDEWAAFALLSPTRHMLDHPSLSDDWVRTVPTIAALVRDADPGDVFAEVGSVVDVVERLWSDLAECVDEVARLSLSAG